MSHQILSGAKWIRGVRGFGKRKIDRVKKSKATYLSLRRSVLWARRFFALGAVDGKKRRV